MNVEVPLGTIWLHQHDSDVRPRCCSDGYGLDQGPISTNGNMGEASWSNGGDAICYPAAMRATTARRFGDRGRSLLLALSLVAPAAMASQIIPAGGKAILHDGFYDLACTDLTVRGVLDIGTGTYANVSNLTVGPFGVIQGAGTIRYSGKLSVNGPIQSSVKLVVNPPSNAACPGPPLVIGNAVNPAPALGSSMLVALATLMMLLALFALREQAAAQRSGEANGATK